MSKEPVIDKDTYRTPWEMFYYAQSRFGVFDYDTACTKANALAKPVWELPGFKRGDALSKVWPDEPWILYWCNPPYSKGNIEQFVGMATRLKNASVVFLIPPSNGETRYTWLHECCYEVHIIGRLAFRHPTKNKTISGNRGGSSLFVTNPHNYGLEAGERETVQRAEAYRLGEKEMDL